MVSLLYNQVKNSLLLSFTLFVLHNSGWINWQQRRECPIYLQHQNGRNSSTSFYVKNAIAYFGGLNIFDDDDLLRHGFWIVVCSCIYVHFFRLFPTSFAIHQTLIRHVLLKLEWLNDCRISCREMQSVLKIVNSPFCYVGCHVLIIAIYMTQIIFDIFCCEGLLFIKFLLLRIWMFLNVGLLIEIMTLFLFRRWLKGQSEKPDEQ